MKSIFILATIFVYFAIYLDASYAWSGHYYHVRRRGASTLVTYCASWSWWWGCSYYRSYWKTHYYLAGTCLAGWRHNGDQNCNIPICRPSCRNGGQCERPNYCKCPSTSSGATTGCSTLTCSYQRPCFPGDCISGSTCSCEPGFISQRLNDGCIVFNTSHTELSPIVGKSNVTLANIRRTDKRVNFMFSLEGLENTKPGQKAIIWSNQKRFNNLRFEYESYFEPPDNLPTRPSYVHENEIGIVESVIEANVSKVPTKGGLIRDHGSFKQYKCENGFSNENPAKEIATCIIDDDQFATLIEHGDWFNIKFKSTSGGFQKLVNIDRHSEPYATKYYKGLQDIKELQFNFDFIAPKHCSQSGSWGHCDVNSTILKVGKEFTKDPIEIYWSGWTDDLSQVWEYYIEVFKLSPDPYGRLIEMEPLSPLFNATIAHEPAIAYPTYKPNDPGMYSVLLLTRDHANNSRIARRLVLFDNKSEITFNEDPEVRLYVSSAVAETGYMWQTAAKGKDVRIDVHWQNHFINKIHEDNMLLSSVEPYPMQFKEIQDDNLLFSQKFVHDSMDDHEGQRTRDPIQNFHGIVRYEIVKIYTLDDSEPTSGWEVVTPFQEKTSFTEKLADGSRIRIWIRATDVMGNIKADSTLMRVDATPPKISKAGTVGADHAFTSNVQNATYNYTSRISFTASDDESGVHKIGFTITIKTNGKRDRVIYEGYAAARTDTADNPFCKTIEGKCFVPQQQVDLDNCWFMISKSDLETSFASVNVTAYNQALLTASTVFEVGHVNKLNGLEKYNGPENMRIESPTPNGFRVAWDLPEKTSCYGRAEIVLVLLKKTTNGDMKLETYYTSGTSKYFDILGLDAEADYMIDFGMKLPNASAVQQTGVALSVKTPAQVQDKGTDTGVIVGIVIGFLVLVALVVVVMIFLIRRGYIHPAQRVRSVRRAVTRKVRRPRSHVISGNGARSFDNAAYNNRQSELYIYGGMDMEAPKIWHISRNDVVFESLIKNGHFANIYKAKLRSKKGQAGDVVAKTLKEGFTPDDELLMKAKINFTGEMVGEHPNILKFIGAVISDDAMGPFIIYEYCAHGPLRDYLAEQRNNVTIDLQENLFRFGLDISKGMEFLAGKGIVHRRLAARNILLTFINEVKIAGFGPQPNEEDGGDAGKEKRERIPIKWMAPECMGSTRDANEQSDVWSFAVVLWEIFSLGETPYEGKGADLPRRLKKGERLGKPEQCDDTWYGVMQKCWAYEAKKRPLFRDIRDELDNLFEASPGDDYYFYKR
ncbi:uncharacterized protein LOC128549125 isoform X2 [Mercenaria mercenaria]|uniref:uncharacterized protein LOC128549125 isoform X2 n=1 Tax=Mercenaria mercenaria TaxID=6596 RepID=UPI00234F7186|nr:uncharacterized protein LOC128549125 isoform X2 [Mercenaria mercenaria]